MEGEKRSRRRALALALCILAAGAFAAGIVVGGCGSDDAERPASSLRPWLGEAAALSPDQLAGQRLIAGLQGTAVPATLRRAIHAGGVAGVILFADNFPSRAAGRRLVRALQAIPRPPGLRQPLLVMADQEGGLVKRIDGPPAASAEEMAARGPTYSRRQGRLTALNLRTVGVNVNLAPVLDVARPGGAIATTDRGWGSSPAEVAATAVPFATAMQGAGVAATAKHFPGIGAVYGDTDAEVERIAVSKRELRRVDELPFRRFSAAGGELVMLSAAIYPAFSPKPAMVVREIASGELRGRLGFAGVSITDALDTTSALSVGDPAGVGVAAARAGVDLLLYTDPGPARAAARALAGQLRRGVIPRPDFERSAARVLRLRHRLAG